MNLILKESFVTYSRVFSPWAALYFLQSLLINLGLGYPFSLLCTVTFTIILLLLWRISFRVQEVLVGISSLVVVCYFPFARAYGAPDLNILLVSHSTDMGESIEILMIPSWYSYVIDIFISVLGVTAIRRKKKSGKACWNTFDGLYLVFNMAAFFVASMQNLVWGGVFELKDTGYSVFRSVKDVIVNNNEVIEEQERMAKLSGMKDIWTITAVKPRYQIYVVAVGESVRRGALGVFGDHWNNAPSASSVNGSIFADYIAVNGSMQKLFGLMLNRVANGKPQFQDNLVIPVNRAGSRTWWFSSQSQIGEHDTAIVSIAKRTDEVYFLKEGNLKADKNTKDEALLNMTAQALAQEHS